MATPLGYCVQFHKYAGKDSIPQKYGNIGLCLGVSVVANLVNKLPIMQKTSNYHLFKDNYFTRPTLLRHLSEMRVATTGTVRANWMENAPLRYIVKWKRSVGQMWLLMFCWTSLQYVGNIIKSWMPFPPWLVNKKFNRLNLIAIVKNGDWILKNLTS